MLWRLAAFLLISNPVLSYAQSEVSEVEREFALAIQALAQAQSYHFSYSITPNADASTLITGEGKADLQANAWQYTRQSDSSDAEVDHSLDGEWIVKDSAWYQDSGTGWAISNGDFTNTGIVSLIGAFSAYDTFKMLGTEESFEEVALIGSEQVDGLEAEHYQFTISNMPLYGTGTYDAWVSKEGDEITRVILRTTPEGGPANQITFTDLNKPVGIEAPL